MWPFDKLLTQRIKDLTRMNENLLGSNTILERELARANERSERLEQKLFDVAGINKPEAIIKSVLNTPINVGGKTGNWGQVKQDLEMKARREYWENKKKENEVEITGIETLEKEMGILGEEDASKIS